MIRIELFYKPQFTDGRALRLRASLEKHFHISIKNLSIVDVFLVEAVSYTHLTLPTKRIV